MKRVALITGITGQDGSYLAESLLEKGYEVHGVVRRAAITDQTVRIGRIQHICDRCILHEASVENYGSMFRIVEIVKPDECYHLAAQSFVGASFEDAHSTLSINIFGTLNLLTAVRDVVPKCRVYFAASSEMFGKVVESPQNELTRFIPMSPYGVSKVAGYDLTRQFREAYDMFACSGILFNHESPRRGMEFVTRKISMGAARIKAGLTHTLELGNLAARRDWGHSREYVEAMWLMLQADKPDDFVIATGETHSVQDFCQAAFAELDLDWKEYVVSSEAFKRPSDVELLLGDASKANAALGWRPEITFNALVKEMVAADYAAVREEVLLKREELR